MNLSKLLFHVTLTLFLTFAQASMGTSLELIVVDESGEEIPCRVLVRSIAGKAFLPKDATSLRTGKDTWFMSSGRSIIEVPAGQLEMRVERGHEYVRVKKRIQVSGKRTVEKVTLLRWINMKERGYVCGENHLHISSDELAPMLVAEGLDFGTSLTWWRGPDPMRPVPDGVGRTRTLSFAGRQVPTSIYDAELEYSWGAAYIQNLPAPMPIKADPGRPNLDYLQHAVDAGAIVHYQGGWSREVLLNALLGCVHTVNICNNNFALHRFQPRRRYSNLLNVEGFPMYENTDIGMLKMNNDTYYRLLNCGLRLAAGAGSATGVKEAPVGYNRSYVRAGTKASIDDFYRGWIAGRNFVTNGPMLFVKTSDDQRPGDTIDLPEKGGSVELRIDASWERPLAEVEVVVNGKVNVRLKANGKKRVVVNASVDIQKGAWICVRCTAQDPLLSQEELTRYENPNKQARLPVAPSRLRFAHSSPIYVTVGGRTVADEKSIKEGLLMLQRLQEIINDKAIPSYRARMSASIAQAKRLLNRKLER